LNERGPFGFSQTFKLSFTVPPNVF
jgi:hypothetical protein